MKKKSKYSYKYNKVICIFLLLIALAIIISIIQIENFYREHKLIVGEETKHIAAYIPVEDIDVETSIEMCKNEEKEISILIKPANATSKNFEIISENNEIVQVIKEDNNEKSKILLKSLEKGKTNIIVKLEDESISKSVEVTVRPKIEKIDGLTYVEGILVVNKQYEVPSTYNPGVNKEALNAFEKMKKAAQKDDIILTIKSGFRSYQSQKTIYNNNVSMHGEKSANRFSAKPGQSEHQTGLAFDLNSTLWSFANTKEAKWIANNCHKYGFIVRYPKDKEEITGYKYEAWHVRYLGVETATAVKNSGLCLEEYLGIN